MKVNVLCERAAAVIFLLFTFYFLPFTSCCYAGISDRVVAFVDDQAVTLSEFQEEYRNTLKVTPDVTGEDVINTMINRILLLREARKYRIDAPSQEEMMREYIDLKVRAFIKVGEPDAEEFYLKNINQFSGKVYDDVKVEIEKYLAERELNERLKETLKELRKNAYIKIQLNP